MSYVKAAVVIAVLLLVAHCAFGAPPPAGSEDARTFAPFPDFVRTLHACCDLSDCRPVDARIDGDHWQFAATHAHFGAATREHWVTVHDTAIRRGPHPTGRAIACYRYSAPGTGYAPGGPPYPMPEFDGVYCFWPPTGT